MIFSSSHVRAHESFTGSPDEWLRKQFVTAELAGMRAVKSLHPDARFSKPVKFKMAGNAQKRIIEGYVSTSQLDRGGDVVKPEAFKETMPAYMTNPLCCYFHKWDMPVGNVTDYRIDDIGLWVRVKIAEGIDWIEKKAWPEIQNGLVRAFSFGYKTDEAQPERLSDGKMANVIGKLTLLEVSVVSVPMNPSSLFALSGGL